MSSHRETARQIIGPIVTSMTGEKRRIIRKALREAWTGMRFGTKYRIYCEEVAIALRERSRRPLSRHKPKRPSEIMPSMREWAINNGVCEVAAVFDVDSSPEPSTAPSGDLL